MKSISIRSGQKVPTWAATLAACVFLIPMLVIFYFFSVAPLGAWLDAEDWPTVECTITHSEMRIEQDSDGDSIYSLDIVYDYTWEGIEYTGSKFDFTGGNHYSRNAMVAFVESYAVGTKQQCFVNPSAPEEAVLNRDFNIMYLLGVFILVASIAIVIGLLLYNRNRGPKSLSVRGKLQERPIAPLNTTESIALKGGSNPFLILILVTIFALFWNAIVIGISISILSDMDPNQIDWFPTLFMIPFLLVGFGLFCAVFYCFLALFNPKPDLTLTPGYLPLGGIAALEWRFRGDPSRIRKLTLTLKGEEKATYRRGTDTVTDSNCFEAVILVDTDVKEEMAQGSITLSIPEFSAPTFVASNNKIRWYLSVEGDIPRWPDVKQEFELTVAPLPTGRDTITPPLAEFTRK